MFPTSTMKEQLRNVRLNEIISSFVVPLMTRGVIKQTDKKSLHRLYEESHGIKIISTKDIDLPATKFQESMVSSFLFDNIDRFVIDWFTIHVIIYLFSYLIFYFREKLFVIPSYESELMRAINEVSHLKILLFNHILQKTNNIIL